MYVCIICMHTCLSYMNVNVYINMFCACLCTNVCIHACMHVYVFVYVCVCMCFIYACVFIFIGILTHPHTLSRSLIHKHTRTHSSTLSHALSLSYTHTHTHVHTHRIKLDHAVLILPRSCLSNEKIVADLGMIEVENVQTPARSDYEAPSVEWHVKFKNMKLETFSEEGHGSVVVEHVDGWAEALPARDKMCNRDGSGEVLPALPDGCAEPLPPPHPPSLHCPPGPDLHVKVCVCGCVGVWK